MAYSAGMRNHRIHIMVRDAAISKFGTNRQYRYATTVWAAVTFNKGVKAMREGAMDAYDTVLVRMLYNKQIDRDSMIVYDGRTWTIQSFNRDYDTNEIQITMQEAAGKDLSGLIPYTPSSSAISGGDQQQHEI